MNRFSTTSDPEEVVEDSEPERVRLRNQSRTTIRSTRSPLDTHLVASENCQQQQSFSDGGLQTLATTVTETVGLYITTCCHHLLNYVKSRFKSSIWR